MSILARQSSSVGEKVQCWCCRPLCCCQFCEPLGNILAGLIQTDISVSLSQFSELSLDVDSNGMSLGVKNCASFCQLLSTTVMVPGTECNQGIRVTTTVLSRCRSADSKVKSCASEKKLGWIREVSGVGVVIL